MGLEYLDRGEPVIHSVVPMDHRRLMSIISDIKRGWKGGTPQEYEAMEYGIQKFHDYLVKKK